MCFKKFREELEKSGLNEGTIIKYISDIKQFNNFIRKKEDKSINKMTTEEIKKMFDSYIKHLEKDKYKPTTINGKIIIINKYLKFTGIGCRHNYLKVQKKMYIENVLTIGEYKRLLEQCDNRRDYIILKTLANTGIRVSELLSLTVQDIYKKQIYIKGKGGKYREIIVSSQLRSMLIDYVENYRLNTDKNQLFTGKRGALKRDAINKIILKYAKRGHVKKAKAHPHSCRHFFGKRLAESGESLDMIQNYLGHESIATTSIYTKRSKEELEKTLDKNFI